MSNPILEKYSSFIDKPFTAHSPVVKMLQPILKHIAEGEIAVEIMVTDQMMNSIGILHGGMMALMLDEVIGGTTFTLADGNFYATSSLNCHFLSSAKPGDLLRIESNIVRQGRRVIYAEGKIYNLTRNKIVAAGSCDLIITEARIKTEF